MAEEIKIVVKQEQQGTALKDAEKDAARLQQAAGKASTATAAPAKEEAQHSERRLDAEKKITREKKEHHAVSKAKGHGGNAQMIGDILDQVTGQQGWVFRLRGASQLPHILGGLGPLGMAGLGAGALAAGALAIASHRIGEGDKNVAEQNALRETRLANARQRARTETYGSGDEAETAALNAKDRLEELQARHATIQDEMGSGLMGHLDRALGTNFRRGIFGKSAKQRELEENERAQATARIDAQKQQEIAQKKFVNEGGMDEIRAQELSNQGKVREANQLRDNVTWWAKYKAVLAQVGEGRADLAKEAADAEIFGKQRERAGNFAGLVNARTGAAGAANIARLAAAQMGGGDPRLLGVLRDIHGQGKEATAIAGDAWREKFRQRRAHE